MTALAIGPSGGFFNRTQNSGHAAAALVDRVLKHAFVHYEQPITLDPRERALQSLKGIFDTHRQQGWDGYGALPISEDAYLEACRLIQLLPGDIEVPEFSADPRGAISFEWYRGPGWVFTLTTKGAGMVVYAGLMGEGNRAYGTQKFSESIPKVILQHIRRVYP